MAKDKESSEKASNKPRMGVILRQTAGGQKSANRREDLEELKERYKSMCKLLKTLEKATRQRHTALLEVDKARAAVSQVLATMSKDTVLADVVGTPSTEERSASDGTYAGAQKALSEKTESRAEEYKEFAIEYVQQWEKSLTTRVGEDMKKTDLLRREADHYKTKVESLKTSVKRTEDRGKVVPPATIEKLQRNREKLQEANQAHDEASRKLFLLMEEVVDRSWRDLHPLLIKTIQFDFDVHRDEGKIYNNVKDLVTNLKDLASQYKIPKKDRLHKMATVDPEKLSTRPGGTEVLHSFESSSSNGDENSLPEQAPKREAARMEAV